MKIFAVAIRNSLRLYVRNETAAAALTPPEALLDTQFVLQYPHPLEKAFNLFMTLQRDTMAHLS